MFEFHKHDDGTYSIRMSAAQTLFVLASLASIFQQRLERATFAPIREMYMDRIEKVSAWSLQVET